MKYLIVFHSRRGLLFLNLFSLCGRFGARMKYFLEGLFVLKQKEV